MPYVACLRPFVQRVFACIYSAPQKQLQRSRITEEAPVVPTERTTSPLRSTSSRYVNVYG